MRTKKKSEAIPHQELSDWFLKQGGDVMSPELIAREIKRIRVDHRLPDAASNILERHLPSWISRVRFDMEGRYKCTLYCVKGHGYKVASPRELAVYTARFLRRTLTHADRTMRLADIVDRKKMPAAIREVFFDQTGKVKSFRKNGAKFMMQFSGFLAEEIKKRRELGNEKASKKSNKS